MKCSVSAAAIVAAVSVCSTLVRGAEPKPSPSSLPEAAASAKLARDDFGNGFDHVVALREEESLVHETSLLMFSYKWYQSLSLGFDVAIATIGAKAVKSIKIASKLPKKPSTSPKSSKNGPKSSKNGTKSSKNGKSSKAVTNSPTDSPIAPDCYPEICREKIEKQVRDASSKVDNLEALDDEESPQSQASRWISEECNEGTNIINPCDESKTELNQQRYALAVMYYSLGGDSWIESGNWTSELNYCDWGGTIDCDKIENVLKLKLDKNNMAGAIPPEIGVLIYMTVFSALDNAMTGHIPTSLGLIEALKTLDIEENEMTGDLFQPEYSGPEGLTNIVNWRASKNRFTGMIPTEIGRWQNLRSLWFANNEIIGTIPTEVGELAEMETFLINSNQISGPIPDDIQEQENLRKISLADNLITGTIPENLYTNTMLEEVILGSNSLTGTISGKIGDLQLLEQFWVDSNQLTGTMPSQLGILSKLRELFLDDNNLTGDIPNELSNLTSLKFLSLNNNGLGGPIPPGLFSPNLDNLKLLYLHFNELTGPVPENYGQSEALRDLYLNNNRLTGTLPAIAGGQLPLLNEFLIYDNDINGTVPASVCLLRSKAILDDLWADCGGASPKIECDFPECCNRCFD